MKNVLCVIFFPFRNHSFRKWKTSFWIQKLLTIVCWRYRIFCVCVIYLNMRYKRNILWKTNGELEEISKRSGVVSTLRFADTVAVVCVCCLFFLYSFNIAWPLIWLSCVSFPVNISLHLYSTWKRKGSHKKNISIYTCIMYIHIYHHPWPSQREVVCVGEHARW